VGIEISSSSFDSHQVSHPGGEREGGERERGGGGVGGGGYPTGGGGLGGGSGKMTIKRMPPPLKNAQKVLVTKAFGDDGVGTGEEGATPPARPTTNRQGNVTGNLGASQGGRGWRGGEKERDGVAAAFGEMGLGGGGDGSPCTVLPTLASPRMMSRSPQARPYLRGGRGGGEGETWSMQGEQVFCVPPKNLLPEVLCALKSTP
jgi:hypothetical protein